MAVDAEQVQPAIQIVIEEENAKLQQEPAGRTDAFGNRFVEEIRRRVLRDIQRGHFVREIADGDPEFVVVAVVRRVNAHGAARVAEVVKGDTGLGADFLERAIALIQKHEVRHRIIGDHQINPAIGVQIHRRHAQ